MAKPIRYVFVAALFACVGNPLSAVERPLNLVFILVDDLGWTDLGCYGSDFYKTPRLDQLAKGSLRFTNAYAASPVCSPTRAAILTGKSPARLDMTIWYEGAVEGGPKDRMLLGAASHPNLPLSETTLAELFKDAGYFTAHVGKWHLGTAEYYPETQGFDINVGGTFWGAPATFFHPFTGRWSESDPQFRYVPGLQPSQSGDYLTDRLTDEALNIIDQIHDRPFMLNLWYHTVHSPIEGKTEYVEYFQQMDPGENHNEPRYAAMVKSMDENIGRVIDKLKERDLVKNTVVIFASDNGGVDFSQRGIVPTSNAPLRSGKGTLYEGGIRVPMLIHWPGRTMPGTVCHELVTSQDFLSTLVDGFGLASDDRTLLDGVTLIKLLENPDMKLDRTDLFWHFPHYYPRMTPGSAVRKGDLKLIHYYEDNHVELYDLKSDIGESKDLAMQQPQVANELLQLLNHWRIRMGANAPITN